ncbi:hypothetical protein QR680_015452 [Steinernema hermaphroditum]|uniref:Peptidase metallopeptidase domain-containing protein n=1 Tax=Steinernema hermaphroditum TaxID=289476 RepID=A0AA39H7Q8_9BILA|nr:hypothetical protein QR680_015452 [Steinernema hermaphroditum]
MFVKCAVLQVALLLSLCSTAAVDVTDNEIKYLEKYGYIDTDKDVAFLRSPSFYEERIKEFQEMFALPITGKIDSATRQRMSTPRCGMPDKRRTRRQRRNTVRKWPKERLTYWLKNTPRSEYTANQIRTAIAKAFGLWQAVANIEFVWKDSEDGRDVDIALSFEDREHGDSYPFDESVLAHAFFPTHGDVHFNNEQDFTIFYEGPKGGRRHKLFSIAAHEIGHSLGLDHMNKIDSIMFPNDEYSPTRLSSDDIAAIQSLYGVNTASNRFEDTGYEVSIKPDSREDVVDEPSPDPCDGRIDAAAKIGDEVYMFKGRWFWTFKDGRLHSSPRRASQLWPAIAGKVDSVLTYKRYTYFFVADNVYIYDSDGRLYSQVKLTKFGIPEHVQKIRLAFLRYRNPNAPTFHLWSGSVNYQYDVKAKTTSTVRIDNDFDDATASLDVDKDNYIFTPWGLRKFDKQAHRYREPIPFSSLFECEGEGGERGHSRRGRPVVGITYLEKYGYVHIDKDVATFRSSTFYEERVKEFQEMFALPITGKIDSATKQMMSTPRCGMPDKRRTRRYHRSIVRRWPKHRVTYWLKNSPDSEYSYDQIRTVISRAFEVWQKVTNIEFKWQDSYDGFDVDIAISFEDKEHGADHSFGDHDLAHAFLPPRGDIHFNNKHDFAIFYEGPTRGHRPKLFSIALNEIGHSLGLDHMNKIDSIMFPNDEYSPTRLSSDDIAAIQSLYGVKETSSEIEDYEDDVVIESESEEEADSDEPAPDPCDSRIDAAAKIGHEVYVFKGKWFWTFKHKSLFHGPRKVAEHWPHLPGNVDAVLSYKNYSYFFIGDKVYIYSKNRRFRKVVKLTAYGIAAYVKKIRLAFVWYQDQNTPIFFMWSDTVVYKYDVKAKRISTFPITEKWNGATANLDMNGDNYIFTPKGLHKFHNGSYTYEEPTALKCVLQCGANDGRLSCERSAQLRHALLVALSVQNVNHMTYRLQGSLFGW